MYQHIPGVSSRNKCSLQTGGKLSPAEAFRQLETLWSQLQASDKLEMLDITDGQSTCPYE
ncbi:DUF7219 family protein, partial [Fischerella thermalis]|uniref:DUF7219 family protein n=1 Tax=Fischerella thermalis TaxID=372787 RepID=UPI003F688E60